MFQALDGPAKQYTLAVTDAAVVEVVKPTETALGDRKVVTMMSTDGSFRVFFADGTNIPSVADVSNDGFKHFKFAKDSYEASGTQPLYVISESGNINIQISERA